jgi:cytidine deaminase
MKEKEIRFSYTLFESVEELAKPIQDLMHLAMQSRDKAYAPYSRFKVGAALRLDDASVVTGNNQENASYPSGLCAERTAIYAAGANYPDAKIDVLAISATSEKHDVLEPIAPCGACRQAIAEYEQKQNQPIQIYFMGTKGRVIHVKALQDILPLAFNNKVL